MLRTAGLGLLLVAAVCVADPGPGPSSGEGYDKTYTSKQVCKVDGKLVVQDGPTCAEQIAVAKWKNAINATGWSFLEVETRDLVRPVIQAYSAGYLEGLLSRPVIRYHIANTVEKHCENYTEYCSRMSKFMVNNLQWVNKQIYDRPNDDEYWSSVNRTFYQLSGIIDGYEGRPFLPALRFELHKIHLINWYGEFFDLDKKLNRTRDPVLDVTGEKCSGLVKVTPNNEDLLISQITMGGFNIMLRVLKMFKFGYERNMFPGYAYSMASYPGMLYSGDDFFLLSSGLAVIETTISTFNVSLYNQVQPDGQLPTWVRMLTANNLARNGREWCQIYSRYNSGTYNNQWIVLDYQRFEKNKPLRDGLFYVLEQMPGKIVYSDMTWFLEKYTYFPSYNIPYFEAIQDYSGYTQQAKKTSWMSWKEAPRAKIFERDHHNVIDIDSLTILMRSNNYKHDEFSKCKCNPPYSSEAAIAARGDLNPSNGTYEFPGMGHRNHGTLDYKGTNLEMFKKLRFRAQGGPPFAGEDLPPFKWSTFDLAINLTHQGHPDEWKFEAVNIEWETNWN